MSPPISSPTAEHDPVSAALADPGVWGRLCAAARTFLVRGSRGRSPVDRAAEAEEVASEAKFRAWDRRADYDPSRNVVTWLVGFVRNVARERARKLPHRLTAVVPALDDLVADLGRSAADAVADGDHVAALLARLPPDDRELIRMVYHDDLTFSEIGARVGATENAVRVRHHRLLARLREVGRAAGEVRP